MSSIINIDNLGKNEFFKCRCCKETKNIQDSIHVKDNLCVECLTKIQVFKENKKKFDFFKIVMKENGEFTKIRRKKLKNAILLSKLMMPTPIFEVTIEDIKNKVQNLKQLDSIKILSFQKNKFTTIIKETKNIHYDTLIKNWEQYLPRIQKINSHKSRFQHFIEFIAKESKFKTFKDLLRDTIIKYIKIYHGEEFKEYRDKVFAEIVAQEKSDILPNVAYYIYKNNERLFYHLFTDFLGFKRSHLTIDKPKAMSRTDFTIRITYVYDNIELKIIKDKLAEIKSSYSPLSVCKWLVLNSEKSFNVVLNYVMKYYYKKLKINSSVGFITNVSSTDSTETQKFISVTYKVSSRES